jgi:hypothetical protein
MAITVCITKNWFNTGYHHIELRGNQPLPVTTTGYRSHFIPMDQFEAFASLEQLVRLWLDDAAKSKEWMKAQEERRQLKVF